MDFLKHKRDIQRLVRKIEHDGDKWGNCCIGDLTIELITSDEVHLNLRNEVEDGELTPTIIIKNTTSPDYPVEVWIAASYMREDLLVNGYYLMTQTPDIYPCKTLKEVFLGMRDWIFQ